MDMYQKRKNSNQNEKFHKVVLNWGNVVSLFLRFRIV